MSDRFRDLALFIRVAETGSFSRAARELGYTQPTVSRLVAALEARLGVRLLVRTTRKVVTTDAGDALLERARAALSELEDAENAARGAESLSGTLRVATPVTFGAREIVPRLASLLESHPSMRVEMIMADRRVDLLEEGVDLAIRLGRLSDSSFVVRRLASAPTFVVASPDYVERHGAPATPLELADHRMILSAESGAERWSFRDSRGHGTSVNLRGNIVVTSTQGLLASAVAGLGIIAASAFACRTELERGELVRLLPDYLLPEVDVHAIMPLGRRLPAKVRAFVDFLGNALRN